MTRHLTRPAEEHPLVVMPVWRIDDRPVYPRSLKVPLNQIERDDWPKFWPTCPFLDALATSWPDDHATTDAHTTQYTVAGEGDFPRLSKTHPQATQWLESIGGGVWMVALFLDQDLPGHRRAHEFTKDQLRKWWKPKLEALQSHPLGQKAGWYKTAGGVRYVWLLDPWLSWRIWPAVFSRVRTEMESLLGPIDDTKDWTRLMRLPRVVRDGRPLRFGYDFGSMVPVDLPAELGAPDASPKELLKESVPKTRVRTETPQIVGPPPTSEPTTLLERACVASAQVRFADVVEKMRNQKVQGDRNGLLYWSAVRLGEVVGWLDREQAEQVLVDAALDAGLRGGEREAVTTVSSGVEEGLRAPKDLRREQLEIIALRVAFTRRGR